MNTAFTTAVLTVMFLSAGAFAKNPLHSVAPEVQNANITTIAKTSAWPVKGLITVDSCKVSRCIAI